MLVKATSFGFLSTSVFYTFDEQRRTGKAHSGPHLCLPSVNLYVGFGPHYIVLYNLWEQ